MPESKVRKAAAEKRKRSSESKDKASTPASTSKGSTSKGSAAKSSHASGSTTTSSSSTAAARSSRRVVDPEPAGRRWLLPAAIVLAVLGVAWGVLYFVDDTLIGFMASLGVWNVVIAAGAVVIAAIGYLALRPRTGTPYAPGGRRWVPVAFITVGLIGVAWLIVYYIAGEYLPFMTALGNWNILIGMVCMAASFVIATLWK